MDTVRIELEGDYAVVLKELKRGTAKQVRALARRDNVTDLTKLDTDDMVEIVLLNQIIEWSFGAVTKESLDNMSDSKYQKLTAKVDKLYSSVPLEKT